MLEFQKFMHDDLCIYLIGQGPYRNPKPIELQLMRIRRYVSALEKKFNVSFQYRDRDIFVDLNYLDQTTWTRVGIGGSVTREFAEAQPRVVWNRGTLEKSAD